LPHRWRANPAYGRTACQGFGSGAMRREHTAVNPTAESPDFSPAEIDVGRRLFAGEWSFLGPAAAIDRLPPFNRIEIAFAGRSNVGKSSLINALTGRRALA